MKRQFLNSRMPFIILLLFSPAATSHCTAAEYIEIATSANGHTVEGMSADGTTVLGHGYDLFDEGIQNWNWKWTREQGLVGLDFSATDASVDGSTIVGYSWVDNVNREAIRWTEADGAVVIAEASAALGVSGDGSVVAGTRNLYVADQREEAFRWTESEGLTTLGVLPGYDSSRANDISDDGTIIVGRSLNHDCREIFGCDMDGFTWSEVDGLTKIDSFGRATRPFAIAGDGTAVVGDVWNEDRNIEAEAFLWTKENGMLGLGHLPALRQTSTATSVNFDGSVVVGYSGRFDAVNQGDLKAFVWDHVHGMRDLQEVLKTEHGINELPRNALEVAVGISNDQMTIVGHTRHLSRGNWLGETAWAIYLDKPLVTFDTDPLQPGDADQDLDFDQLDLVQVQQAAKYLTGRDATWGEGDWNGAPGGTPGRPPEGDGVFDQEDIVAALQANTYLTGPYAAHQVNDSVPDGQTSLVYHSATGELKVETAAGSELTSINIESTTGIFTGEAAQNLSGSFDTDTDINIFKATFGGSFGSLSFGNVAQPGLSEEFLRSDLKVTGSLAAGGDLGNVDLVYAPEPPALALFAFGLLFCVRRLRCGT